MIDEDIKKLDELARLMEGGTLPLEKTLEVFAEGILLIKKCTQTLENAELKVREIVESKAGIFEEKPL